MKRLIVICGDQLNPSAQVLSDFDPDHDAIVMTEAVEEATPRQHKKRLIMFFAAMRHFRNARRAEGKQVYYYALDDTAEKQEAPQTIAEGMLRAAEDFNPDHILITRTGDWRIQEALTKAAGNRLICVEDDHFFTTPDDFAKFAEGRKKLVLEDFYRPLRRKTGWLMNGNEPVGGQWNFDKENRKSFGKDGPPLIPKRRPFEPDDVTRSVQAMVDRMFPDAPGKSDGFAEPVTPDQARQALKDFIDYRLPDFGTYEDAIAMGHVTLYHSRLSAAMNLHLISPKDVCEAALEAYEKGNAPINAVEGFIRQILGWREFVRGLYWHYMPDYAALNKLDANEEVPEFFWTGETDMACVADALSSVLSEGYAHHIQRLMVLGLFLMQYGANPYTVHEWHMGLYLDAIDWVSLPNVVGMSQFGDGGIMGTKPYAASGAYIDRMSDCCKTCPYTPKKAHGGEACPVTALYWDFLAQHEQQFRKNPRMAFQLKNLDRKNPEELASIRDTAKALRNKCARGTRI
ncbi:MAG: cryptochrome/photolyase family protein [Pseudomonadota bacterium]|nr:cryptochrome/photolyase family protein [Pseudomonadota bacterium]